MNRFVAAINSWYKFFSGADRVRETIELAKILVAADKLDEAIACLRNIEDAYRSDSTGGIIADYLDPLIDIKMLEVQELMTRGEQEQVRALFHKAPVFYGQMSDVVEFLNPSAARARAGAGAGAGAGAS